MALAPDSEFDRWAAAPTSPLTEWAAHTLHDTNPCAFLPRAFAVNVTGTVVIESRLGTVVTVAATAGTLFWCRPHKIKTGGTATGITIFK